MKIDSLKDSLNKMPVVKRLAKRILTIPIEKRKSNSIKIYHQWLEKTEPRRSDLDYQRKESQSFSYKPLISVLTPVYNTPALYFKEMVESVINQSYENWELVLIDDASPNPEVRDLIELYAKKDTRITYKFLEKGLHIAGATNEAIRLAKGDFVSLFDHDDILRPNALFEIALSLNKNNKLDFIYTDEDKIIDGVGLRADPFFKPGWNQDFLYSINYITHFSTIRKSIIEKVGYEKGDFNGAQDWEFYLRITRNIKKDNIHHIPIVLYSWRVHAESTAQSLDAKPYVLDAQKKAILEDLSLKKVRSFDLSRDKQYPAQWRLDFKTPSLLKLSIVPTGELAKDTRRHDKINKILNGMNYEVVEWQDIYQAKGDVIAFVPYISKRSGLMLLEMMGDALRSDIALVSGCAANRNEVISNMRTILTESVCDLVESLPDSLTYHYYRTARYNLGDVSNEQVVLIEKSKLDLLVKNKIKLTSVDSMSRLLSEEGFRHLYNPYAKV